MFINLGILGKVLIELVDRTDHSLDSKPRRRLVAALWYPRGQEWSGGSVSAEWNTEHGGNSLALSFNNHTLANQHYWSVREYNEYHCED